jgi:hypothetical protein
MLLLIAAAAVAAVVVVVVVVAAPLAMKSSPHHTKSSGFCLQGFTSKLFHAISQMQTHPHNDIKCNWVNPVIIFFLSSNERG